MNNKVRRFISLFLSVVMVLSLLNGFVLPAKKAEAAPATLNGYTDFSDKLVSHEITVDGQKLNNGDTINPSESFSLKLSFEIKNISDMATGGLKYFFKLPDHISIGNQGSESDQKTLYNSRRDAIGSYYILDDVIYVEFPGYYDGVNAFFEMEASWEDTNNRSKITIPWPDGDEEYKLDFSDLSVVKNQSGYVNQPDGSLKNNFSIVIRGKKDDVAIDNVKFEDIFNHSDYVNILKDTYGEGKDIKVSYYDSTNTLVSNETYKLSDVGSDNGFTLEGLSLTAGGYIKVEYASIIKMDKRLELDGSQKTDSYNNSADASYAYDNPVTGETETLKSSSNVRGSYEGGTDWIMKDASDETKTKYESGTTKTVVPYTVNVNRHRFYSLGGSAVHDEITNYTGGDVVYDTSADSSSYVLRVVDSNNNPDGDRIDQKWVILDDDVYSQLQTLCQGGSSKTEYEEINDSSNNTLKQALLSAIRSQHGGSESAFDEDTALTYIFTDSSNHNFVWITPPDNEPTTYIIHYDTIVDNEVGTFKNGASLWYTEYDVTYAAPGNGWHRPVKKVLNSSKTNFGVYLGEDGNFYVDYKVTVGLAAGSAGFDGISVVDEFANHTVDINGESVALYDFLTGFNADDVDLAHLTGEQNRQLVTPCFEITTDSDNPKVQDVCKNAYAIFYHNVNGDSGAEEFYRGYNANAELVLRDYNSQRYHGDSVEGGQFILYSDVFNYDGSRLVAKKGETVSPKSAVVWLGDLPAADESKGYNIILKYTMQVNPLLIEKLPELLENSTDKYVANNNRAKVYEKYWYGERYIVNLRGAGFIQDAESSYWIGIDDDHPGVTKKLKELASNNAKASYELTVDPDESIDATTATGEMSVKYEIEDVMNIPGLKYIRNSFTLKDKDGKIVWTNVSGKSADSSYSSYADSISLELTNEDSESNRYKILLDNTDGKFTDSNGKLMKLFLSYDVDTSNISTEETIINTSTLAELVKETPNEPEKKTVLGEDTVEFAIDKALEKKLSNKANASNNFISSYYIDVNPNSDNAKELKDINVGDTITIEDELSDTLEVVPNSVKVYQYKGRDFENEEEITNNSNIAYHTDNNTLVVTVKVEDKDNRYRVVYDAKVIGGSNEYVKCVNTASVRGTTVTLDQTIDKVLIHDYRDGSEALRNIIKIEKFDEFDTTKLLDATFDIYEGTVTNNNVSWKLLTDGSTGYDPVRTGDDGVVTVENKLVNDHAVVLVKEDTWYKLVEREAPEDYMLRKEPIYYYVSKTGEDITENNKPNGIDKYVLARLVTDNLDGSKAPIIRVSNQKFGFDINKVLKGTDKNLKGAEFAVYSDSSCNNSSLITKVLDGASEYDTESDGIIKFRNIDAKLDSDTIYLKETKAPDGCVLDENVYTLKIADGFISEISDGNGHSYSYNGQTVTTDGCGKLVSIEGDKELPTLEIYNDEISGRLLVKKTVELASDETLEKSFNFGITIKDKDGKVVSGTFAATKTDVDGNETSVNYTNQSIFTLKNDEQFEITEIPEGYTYEVKEVVDNKFVTTIDQSDSAGSDDKTINGNNAEGTIDESGLDTIEYTNTGTIELKLDKLCVGPDGNNIDIPDGLSFELKSGSETFFKITWDATSKKFKLQDGAHPQIVFNNIENGVDVIGIPLYKNRQYFLSESGADISGLAGKLTYIINGRTLDANNNTVIPFYPNSIKTTYGDYPVDNYVEINAVNTYTESFVETSFEANKVYNKDIKTGDFAFDLYQLKSSSWYIDASSALLQTVYAKADGTISFADVKFIRTGTYYFAIKERVPEDVDRYNTKNGVTYDTALKRINVVVGKNDQTGKLEVTKIENLSELTFTNKYAATGSTTLDGTKRFNKSQDANEFTFKLTEYTDDTYSTVKNDADGNPITEEVGNTSQRRVNADSTFSFGLDYSYEKGDVGKHYYKIVEINPNQEDGITYDDREIKVVVTVKDDDKGSLEVTKEVDAASGIHFDNTYNASGKIALTGDKTLVNHNITDGQFEFTITEYTNDTYSTVKTDSSNNGITYSATVDATSVGNDGNAVAEIKYPEINYTYDDVGSHYYLVKEVIPDGAVENVHNGITYDNSSKKVRVDVYDLGDGKLNVVANYVSGDASFTNTYKATGKIALSGKKILRGRDIKANEFLIYGTCKDVGAGTTSNPAIYGRVATDGTISFDDIEYDESDIGKLYVYTFYENEPNTNPGGLTYSDEEYTMTVSIADGNDGSLVITKTIVNKAGQSVDNLDFVNLYNASASITFTANKVLKGKDIEDGQFNFDIYEGANLVSTGSNDADGNITFAEIKYYIESDENGVNENIGTHNYVVKERVPDPVPGGYTYSNKIYNITVEVTDNGDGTLNVVVTGASVKDGSVTYEITKADTDEATFINKYEAKGKLQFEGTKTLTGRSLDDKEFKFEVFEYKVGTNDAGEETLTATGKTYTGSNATSGKINYELINYIKNESVNDVGMYKYVIKEIIPSVKAGGVTYDDTSYEVYVNVEDAGDGTLSVTPSAVYNALNFANKYEAKGSLTIKAKKMAMMFDNKKVYKDVNSDGEDMGNIFTFEVYEMHDKNAYNGTDVVTDKHARFVNKLVSEGSCKVGGEVNLSDIVYSLSDVGNHIYRFVEKAGNAKGYTYDQSEYFIVVDVEDGREGILIITVEEVTRDEAVRKLLAHGADYNTTANDGEGVNDPTDPSIISSGATVYDDGKAFYESEFINTYKAETYLSFTGDKTVENLELNDFSKKVMTDGAFRFSISEYNKSGKKIKSSEELTGKSLKDGSILFDAIHYTVKDMGTHYYMITEDTDKQISNVIYSAKPVCVKVDVRNAGDGTLTTECTYARTDDIKAFIEESDIKTIEKASFVNKLTEVKLKKITESGKGLAGAKMAILNKKGKVVYRFTSEEDETTVYGLSKDVTYTLHETKAPKGYVLADDIDFRIDEKGKVYILKGKNKKKTDVIKMTDKKLHKKISDDADSDNDKNQDTDKDEDTKGANRDRDTETDTNDESRTVETGDYSRMVTMLVIFVLSGMGNVYLLSYKRRNKKSNKSSNN